jgi:hypothetical protein
MPYNRRAGGGKAPMFHMLVCFNLKPGNTIEQFSSALVNFADHLRGIDLAQTVGPVGLRQSDTPLDTDRERAHKYFVIMSFRDRQQSDDAYKYLKQHADPGESIHREVYSRASEPIFICWQDMD